MPSTYYVGLDVSLKTTQVCIVDDQFTIISETKVETDPETLALYLYDQGLTYERVGLEAGPMSQWLYAGMAKARLPVICIETRHARDFIKSQLNKNDRNDARGIARMMMCGIFKPVHVKTLESQRLRVLLSSRAIVRDKMVDIEISIRGLLRNFGLRVGAVTRSKYEARIRELVGEDRYLQAAIFPLLAALRAMREQFAALHKQVLIFCRDDEVCRRLMTCPGVGPIVALTYKTAIDIPERFQTSKAVGAHVGLTPRQYQSGETDVLGRITKCGDAEVRTALVEAALTLITNVKKPSPLKSWALKVAKRRGTQKAAIAVARRLAVILHRMWVDGTDFRWADEVEEVAA